MLSGSRTEAELLLPYSEAGLVDTLRREAVILSLEYREDGISVKAILDQSLYGRLREWIPAYQQQKEDWD